MAVGNVSLEQVREVAPLNSACVACGHENPGGLHLEFHVGRKCASARWTTRAGWESFRGIIHGGVISTVMDEAMSKAIISEGYQALTAELKIRFRAKVSVDEELRVQGWVVSVQKRKIVAEATLTTADGMEKAHAWSAFLVVRNP
ncbi:MAG TPA: PaaI family thioesterase [Acidobacteriaceae bacterium]